MKRCLTHSPMTHRHRNFSSSSASFRLIRDWNSQSGENYKFSCAYPSYFRSLLDFLLDVKLLKLGEAFYLSGRELEEPALELPNGSCVSQWMITFHDRAVRKIVTTINFTSWKEERVEVNHSFFEILNTNPAINYFRLRFLFAQQFVRSILQGIDKLLSKTIKKCKKA